MLPLVLGIGSFFGALLMGTALLSMGTGERRWRGPAKADDQGRVSLGRVGAAFAPLEMAPFTLKWPSEVEHPHASIPELPWPSETWDDEYFGTRSRDDVRKISETARALDIKRARTTQQAQRRQAGLAEPEPEVAAAPAPKKDKKDKKRKKELQAEAQRRAGKVVDAAAEAGQEALVTESSQAAADFFAHTGAPGGVPNAEEIAALVRDYGLQGAIERIRQMTGWDFQTATNHLAQTFRNRKT